eukprot:scaffold49820_cov44-Phaeocystis_antarctica.AAC.1
MTRGWLRSIPSNAASNLAYADLARPNQNNLQAPRQNVASSTRQAASSPQVESEYTACSPKTC